MLRVEFYDPKTFGFTQRTVELVTVKADSSEGEWKIEVKFLDGEEDETNDAIDIIVTHPNKREQFWTLELEM